VCSSFCIKTGAGEQATADGTHTKQMNMFFKKKLMPNGEES